MAQNPTGSVEIPLNTFAGLVTNQDPIALPMGASPACSDVTFLPGGVSSRPCLKKIFASPTYANTTCVYGKSFTDPAGKIWNFYLYSNGGMTYELPLATPGVETALLDDNGNAVFFPAGSYMKSITAFGREFFACSDTMHGADIPLQFNGTYLDRVTQDGPGAPPTVQSIPLPSVALAANSAVALTITSVTPSGFVSYEVPDGTGGFNTVSYYTAITVIVSSGASGLTANQSAVTIAGNANPDFNTIFGVSQVLNDTTFVCGAFFPDSEGSGAGGTATPNTGITLQRNNNVVSGTTAAAHNLQVGYQVQVGGIPAGSVGGGIASIAINNEQNPGIATITTNAAHGLTPELNVSMTGIAGTSVGGGVTAISRQGQVVTATTASDHNLAPSAIVTLSGFTVGSFNSTGIVATVPTSNTFTFTQVDVDATDTTGVATLQWPVPNSPTPTFYQVISAPTPTTFQVAINYPDGAWTGGTVTYAWDGIFYVLSVPSATTFTYQQYGPNATSSTAGTLTPFGQAAPGKRLAQVVFLTRMGYTTAPSPPVEFVSNGGQYISVSDIPIGPSNVIARIIAFTGAGGAYYFYIPSTPQVNGLIVGTATQINDNTTTNAVFDFGDQTLFASLGISIQGNNLANQVVLDGALGFAYYGSRLFTYGQRNAVGNLVNMAFDGGYLPSASTQPAGWLSSATPPGSLVTTGRFGFAYQISISPGTPNKLFQSFFEDAYGSPIGAANAKYAANVWLKPSALHIDVTFNVKISSASTGFSSVASFVGTQMSLSGGFRSRAFNNPMPAQIPTDMTLSIYGSSSLTSISLIIDEITVFYTSGTEYLPGMFASYANNPEGFDGVSGVIGPVNDTHQVMDVGIIRDNLYMLTLDPAGRLHETSQGITEPADWVVNEVASNCGTTSTFSMTHSQADDSSASGGEEWFAWYSADGYRIFGGESPDKISQEIQRPIGQTFPGAPSDLNAINPAVLSTVWSLNDPAQKMIYLGIPSGSATAPSVIFALSYLGLDSAAAIVANPPIHKSLSGKLVATDLGRKWTPWKMTMNGAALMYRAAGNLQATFFAGNGLAPGITGFANAYTLNAGYYTDDDYGIVAPYYVTYGHPDRDTEQQEKLGGGLKILTYLQAFFFGVGFMNWSVLYNSLANTAALPGSYLMQTSPLRNAEWAGGQATGQRFFIKFASVPNPAGITAHPTTDNAFSLSVLVVGMKPNKFRVTGSYP